MINNNLFSLAEEAAYSAKGHFKTSDWIEYKLYAFVSVPMFMSLLLVFFDYSDSTAKILSFIGFAFSIFALISLKISNKGNSNDLVKYHMKIGGEYLVIYKELRQIYFNNEKNNLQEIRERVSKLDKETCNLKISTVGRWWAKLRIKKEMDLSWLIK